MDKRIKSNIWKYYVFSFFAYFVVFLPYIVYYFQKLGLSLGEVAIINGAMAALVFVFEIPSGYVADRIGRKNSLILSSLLYILALIILYKSTTFTFFFISQIISGIGSAFLSGADSALLYDSLLSLKRENEFKKIYGRSKIFEEIAVILSALVGSWLIIYGFQITVLITGVGHLIMLGALFTIIEPTIHKKLEPLPFRDELQNLFRIVKKSVQDKKLLGLSIYSFIVLGFSNTIFVMYQPYFGATNLPLYAYGLIFAFFSIFTALAAWKVHEIESKLGIFKSLLIMPLFLVLSFIGVSTFFVWWGFIFFIFREFVRGYIFPVIGDYTHKLSQSNERATILSVQNMFSRLGLLFISITFGFFSDAFGLRKIFFAAGIILLIFTIIFIIIFRKKSITF